MSREAALVALEQVWRSCRAEPGFVRELRERLADHAGRPTPLTRADRLSDHLGGGFRLYLKREDLAHTGTDEINACLGQALLARHMGKSRLVIGAGACRHGLAAASAAALFRLRCVIYVDGESALSRELEVSGARRMGAEVVPVTGGSRSSEAADLAAGHDWEANLSDTYYIPSSTGSDPPYPAILRDLQSVVGHEARSQFFEAEGRMPDSIVGPTGRGSGSIGLFQAFLDDREVRMFGVGSGDAGSAAPGSLPGARGEVSAAGRMIPVHVDEEEAGAALRLLAESEGILADRESARGLAFVARSGPVGEIGRTVLVGLSGRGGEEATEAASEGGRTQGRGRG